MIVRWWYKISPLMTQTYTFCIDSFKGENDITASSFLYAIVSWWCKKKSEMKFIFITLKKNWKYNILWNWCVNQRKKYNKKGMCLFTRPFCSQYWVKPQNQIPITIIISFLRCINAFIITLAKISLHIDRFPFLDLWFNKI